MLNKVLESQVVDEGRKSRLSKKTILEIVHSVERGASRREIFNRYGIPKTTLSGWMREYGSPSYHASLKPLSLNILITQSLEKLMGKGSALGKTMRWDG
ncbi:MAG TPA: hypothetical protein VGI82_07445, partial [Chitinophagaceae bacterium]